MKPKVLLLLVCASLLSCADLGPEGEAPRLIPGSSVDGVQFGMSWEEVVRLLGGGYAFGSFDGVPFSGTILGYLTGEHAGLSMWFPEWGEIPSTWGPVIAIEVNESYSGKTREGVGIGSTREQVRAAFGNPGSYTDRDGTPATDSYVMHGKAVFIQYTLGKVISIRMY